MDLLAAAKRALRRRAGFLRIMEVRNKLLLWPTAVATGRREDAEVRRLLGGLPPRQAVVATVIPTYRRPEGLAAAVRSALDQTVRNHVVVVVDDGAGLDAAGFALLPEDPRLVTVSLSVNIGVAGVVRNVGLRLSDSEFVAFLDDDNVWEPDHLARALDALTEPGGPEAVYTALRRLHPDGTELDVLSVPWDRRHAAEEGFLDTNAFVARRNRDLRFSRLRRHRDVVPREDWELVFRYSRRRRIAHLPVPTVRYLVNPASYWSAWGRQPGPAPEPTG
ncbi:glycosyltransferase family 2 protein [Streptacidiphilus monticola]|uniref:Glycosyltransferase family 2 protein n=1 Tax=Streptacidiphilus monticola TaxID=2161674 RepID=A0ABW1G8B0_9ACTN